MASLFLDLRIDWAFKRIFGSPSSEPILKGFLNDCLYGGRSEVESVTILDPYLPALINKMKNSAVDVRAMLGTGEEVIIEMQMVNVEAFTKRCLFNGAKCLAAQLGRGADYTKVKSVMSITIADSLILPANQHSEGVSRYSILNEVSYQPYPEANLRFIFIELPRLHPAQMAPSHPLRDWLFFLKEASSWAKIPPTVTKPAVRKALQVARRALLTPDESLAMSKRDLYRIDQRNIRLLALKEGREEGREEGEVLKAQAIARELLGRGLDVHFVSEVTHLSLTQLQEAGLVAITKPKRRTPRRS
jgi:predicted transposase/invertase (TIGR01784 family)